MQHLEEGTIHAWLDGELSADEAAAAEAHVRECAQCSALVAEARGLIAASTRILTALDDVPSGVIPEVPRKRHWYDRTDIRAAAAVLLVAGASMIVVKSRDKGMALKSVAVEDRAATFASPVESSVTTDTAAVAEAPQQNAPAPSAVATVPQSEGDAARRSNVKKPPEEALRGKVAGVEQQPEKEVRARDMNKSVAQAPSPRLVGPPSMMAMVDTTRSMGLGALTDADKTRIILPRAGRIEGRITDESTVKGIAGANVMVQGTTLSVVTDNEGKFKIDNVPAGEQRLIVRRLGYNAQTIPLSVKDTAITANVTLSANSTSLSEVVVTGVATATSVRAAAAAKSAPVLRQLRSDSTGGIRRTVYEYSPGVEVTLVESPEIQANARRDERAANAMIVQSAPATAPSVPARQATNTITWTDRGRKYTLSGPLSTKDLEALKAKLMATRR